ncbi:hypothetical protein EVS81_13215 [Leucobacter triazinivorans]|uniref:DNA (cytosine-5-)-methyltransferase n=1 Tax=Leucobacter triazinivorans TaxID=1784719 RepID=A0A4P6KGP1_9MICO|nr:hypothetical protein EVS81_13215 [Leucobacter triazinivorans]
MADQSFTHPAAPLRIGSLFSGYGGLDLAVEEVFDAQTIGSDVGYVDSGFSSRRECDAAYINNFKLHWGKSP